jgi:Tyrosyl-DNA phosphodiesterase
MFNTDASDSAADRLDFLLPHLQILRVHVPSGGHHHSKLILLKFDTGVRVVITTANFTRMDFDQSVSFKHSSSIRVRLCCSTYDRIIQSMQISVVAVCMVWQKL